MAGRLYHHQTLILQSGFLHTVFLDGEIKGQFRYADKDTILQPSEGLSYRMPVDFVDLSTGADATKLIDFLRMVSSILFGVPKDMCLWKLVHSGLISEAFLPASCKKLPISSHSTGCRTI